MSQMKLGLHENKLRLSSVLEPKAKRWRRVEQARRSMKYESIKNADSLLNASKIYQSRSIIGGDTFAMDSLVFGPRRWMLTQLKSADSNATQSCNFKCSKQQSNWLTFLGCGCARSAIKHDLAASRSYSLVVSIMLLLIFAFSFTFILAVAADSTQTFNDQQAIATAAARLNDNNQDYNQWFSKDFPTQQKQTIKKSSLDLVSSADLPAEFRNLDGDNENGNEAPKEQSKLAKLCQQTSSVLASVLPAPFGDHKRSILCQFFGQVSVAGAPKQSAKSQRNPSNEADSITILQQHQQQPITVRAFGRHPIQIVLEQQHRQLLARVPAAANISVASLPKPIQDLKSSASVLDYSYQQKLEPPAFMRLVKNLPKESHSKFSMPVADTSTSFKPISLHQTTSKLISTSGWRIFNQSLDSTSTPTAHSFTSQSPSSFIQITTPKTLNIDLPQTRLIFNINATPNIDSKKLDTFKLQAGLMKNESATTISVQLRALQPGKRSESVDIGNSTQLLVMGKPPGFDHKSSQLATEEKQVIIRKRSEALKSTTKSAELKYQEDPFQRADVRTIEVMSQQNNQNNSSTDNLKKRLQSVTSTTSTTTQKPTADLNQVRRREELVIAAINNLTRIAFGNQLRDTVKVINKLIDQQSNLFNVNKVGDPMLPSESRQIVSEDKFKLSKSSKFLAMSGKENFISLTTNKSRQKQIPSSTTQSQFKSTKKPKKQSIIQQQQPTSTIPPTRSTKKSPFSSRKIASSFSPSELQLSKQNERKSSSESHRVMGAHTVSRSLVLEPVSKVSKLFDFDSTASASITDIHRDKTPWRFSSTSKVPIMRASTTKFATSTSISPNAVSQVESQTLVPRVTRLPWLLLDNSAYHSDLFGGMNLLSDNKPSTTDVIRKWTAKKEPMQTTLGGTQALVLNRLDNKADRLKIDSLTTLKMSLATQSTSTSTIQPSGLIQSRWIPTVSVTRPSSTITTTLITTTPIPVNTTKNAQVKEESQTVPSVKETLTQNDLNEARASDSISKYTTHWNEANELLATTRRFFQQPLPQIANTGEFFSAETISSWPERYQTMMGQALDGSQTTPSFETTRRNGETFETISSTAKHKFETTPFIAEPLRTTRSDKTIMTDLSNISVLPSNHKLTTTDGAKQNQTITLADFIQEETTSGPYTKQMLPTPSISYTLVGPYTENIEQPTSEKHGEISAHTISPYIATKFPRILGDLLNDEKNNGTNPLRPPYLESHENDQQSNPVHLFDNHELSKPYVSRKLYELLVPHTRNFVGLQNPLNQQRFNLSALKFLAQSLFSPAMQYNESMIALGGENHLSSQYSNISNSQRLLDLLGASLPFSYYELLLNESTTPETNKTSMSGKSILSKAGNLLNDLRQLEHKKAAAILAAIRYQVPSPLVRPWDLASDLHSMRELSQISDRLDDYHITDKDYIRESLLLARARKAIKTALLKQRVIPRDELEARLNGNKRLDIEQETISNRRSDPEKSLGILYSSNIDDHEYDINNDTRYNETDYSIVHERLPLIGLDKSDIGNFSKAWLNKLLLSSKMPANLTRNNSLSNDSDLIDIYNASTRGLKEDDISEDVQYPRYIHFTQYQKHHLQSSEVAAKLKNNSARIMSSTDYIIQNDDETKMNNKTNIASDEAQQIRKKTSNFHCSDRQAGFYPDTRTSCQTFYHCSSTGHLLTFNCPQQTRFDEKSLKCGPWFEVPCDLSRIKSKS